MGKNLAEGCEALKLEPCRGHCGKYVIFNSFTFYYFQINPLFSADFFQKYASTLIIVAMRVVAVAINARKFIEWLHQNQQEERY